jgi:DNA-binding response OmpR family regulator
MHVALVSWSQSSYPATVRWWLIEDDVALQRMLQKYVRAAGEQVEVFDTVPAVVAACAALDANTRPDVTCVDFGLPGGSGVALIRQLRQHPLIRPMVIIGMSARVDVTDHAAALDAGADAFMPKPLRAADILALGHRLLKERT